MAFMERVTMKEYIELYQKMREDHQKKWGSYYYPQNMQEFEELNQRIFKIIWKIKTKILIKRQEQNRTLTCSFATLNILLTTLLLARRIIRS